MSRDTQLIQKPWIFVLTGLFHHNTGSIIKWSTAGLNSEFVSSPRLVVVPRLKNPVRPTIYPYLQGGKRWIHAFHKGISTNWNANSSYIFWTLHVYWNNEQPLIFSHEKVFLSYTEYNKWSLNFGYANQQKRDMVILCWLSV